MSFFVIAAGLMGKLVFSLGAREFGEKLKDVRTQRRMARLVEDAVDRIVEQTEEYLRAEKVTETRKEILITSLCTRLQTLVDDPQQFFAGNLDGALIFKQCHPKGELPEEIREEGLGQFYTVLFPQIAHFLAGSRIALVQWQAEGFREEFKRLSQLAEEIRAMSAKVADVPGAVSGALADKANQESETLLREFAQTLLNNLLLRLDLSPLRAERALHGSLGDHFVVPAIRERKERAEAIGEEETIRTALATPGVRQILHGGAGVGKTTCCLWLQSRLLQAGDGRVAVVLRLREVPDIENHSLLDLLRDRAGTHLRDALTDSVLRKWYVSGRLALILDGFDEVPEQRRDAVEHWIRALDAVAKKTVIVVTSRPLQSGHLENLKKPWKQWDLLPFDERRIVEFIERWHYYLPEGELSATERKVDAAALARTFFQDPSLRPLADTPLMLGTLLFVHHRDKKLPSGRVDLYERYIAAMLGLRDSGLGIEARATKLTDKEKRRVLAHIALHFHLHGVNEVNDPTMRQLATEALMKFKSEEDVDRLLPALRERTGLLQGPGAWSFMHKTIGEFLVAELICEGSTRLPDRRRLDRKELWLHRHEDPWTAVLFFWAGKTTPRELEEFIDELLDEDSVNATLLALSLVYDQGDRLLHETQRELAIRIIKKGQPTEHQSRGTSVCSTSPVPSFVYQEYGSPNFVLRGLTSAHDTNAFSKLFERGILTSRDLQICDPTVLITLSVSLVWQLDKFSQRVVSDLLGDLDHIPSHDLPLYVFHYRCHQIIDNDNSTGKDVLKALDEWLEMFPQGRSWIPLLLLGLVVMPRRDKLSLLEMVKRIGPILWLWRDKPIADDWLMESVECQGWASTAKVDSFEVLHQILSKKSAFDVGLTKEQHADLLVWCDQMITQRGKLRSHRQKRSQDT